MQPLNALSYTIRDDFSTEEAQSMSLAAAAVRDKFTVLFGELNGNLSIDVDYNTGDCC